MFCNICDRHFRRNHPEHIIEDLVTIFNSNKNRFYKNIVISSRTCNHEDISKHVINGDCWSNEKMLFNLYGFKFDVNFRLYFNVTHCNGTTLDYIDNLDITITTPSETSVDHSTEQTKKMVNSIIAKLFLVEEEDRSECPLEYINHGIKTPYGTVKYEAYYDTKDSDDTEWCYTFTITIIDNDHNEIINIMFHNSEFPLLKRVKDFVSSYIDVTCSSQFFGLTPYESICKILESVCRYNDTYNDLIELIDAHEQWCKNASEHFDNEELSPNYLIFYYKSGYIYTRELTK
jgi:hypothetical protein